MKPIARRSLAALPCLGLFSLWLIACGTDDPSTPSTTGSAGGDGGAGGAGGAGGGGGSAVPPKTTSAIEHLVVIIQENHSFDNHFGRYCTAPTGSNPSCNDGPGCCEAGPDLDPGTGAMPVILTDAVHGGHDPNHLSTCEAEEIDDGKMDKFVSGASCSDPGNFAYADPTIIKPYWDLAASSALADRYFQPVVGASIANDLYFARAAFVFADNTYEPDGVVGAACSGSPTKSYSDLTIGELLNQRGVPWAVYAEGYELMGQAEQMGKCPAPPADCPGAVSAYPCTFDPGDIPFLYYTPLVKDLVWMRDLSTFDGDLANGKLPSVTFIKSIGYKTEHPGAGTKLSVGVAFSTAIIDQILASSYASNTLILLTYDEGGGYFDHVAPPPKNEIDGKDYGVRVPTLAIGPFARKNYVSHVQMDHASIVRFIEWNWLDGDTGQLTGRDLTTPNIGSLLDPSMTEVAVPE